MGSIMFTFASTWDFQQCGILTGVDPDEPVQPPFKLRNPKWCSVSSLAVKIFKRLAKTLIRLRIWAGWSEPLLVTHTTLLEISCHSLFLVSFFSPFWALLLRVGGNRKRYQQATKEDKKSIETVFLIAVCRHLVITLDTWKLPQEIKESPEE